MTKQNFKLLIPTQSQARQEMNEEKPAEEKMAPAISNDIPFATLLFGEIFLKLKRVSYWERLDAKEIINTALIQYLEQFESAMKELPEKELQKMMKLKIVKGRVKSKK